MREFDIRKHYEDQYSRERNIFGSNPDFLVQDLLKFISSGCVIDLGAGEGRNSLYLASEGFVVTAVDIAPTAVERIQEKAKELNLKVETIVGDIREIDLPKNCDVFLCTFAIHHFPRQDGYSFISRLKDNTKLNGLNVILSFTKDGDFYRMNPSADKFLLEKDELKKLYSGWEVLEYREWNEKAFQKKPDGSPMFNITAGIIVRKSA